MIVNYLLWFILIISGSWTIAYGCEILHDSVFLMSEVDENYEVGKILPGSISFVKGNETRDGFLKPQVYTDRTDTLIASEFISVTTNITTNLIEFRLTKPLREFREREWLPNVELEFTLPCCNDDVIYTYLLIIKDDNLYTPTFAASTLDAPSFKGQVTYSFSKGIQICLDSEEDGDSSLSNIIKVKDLDFNPIYSNLTLNCEGSDCTYFKFEITRVNGHMGNVHEIAIKFCSQHQEAFRKNIINGTSFRFTLAVSDSKFVSKASVELTTRINEEYDPVDEDESQFSTLFISIAGTIVFLVLASCTATLVIQSIKNRKAKNLLRQLTEAEIREFLDGSANFEGGGRRSVDVNTPIMALPYNKTVEISREKLRIDETTILGTGAFGIVWKGTVVFSNGEGITVAVKSVKRNVGVLYFKALLSELKIMAYIGKHPNIVSLVGACTHNIRKREVYIAVQYCENGNFHNYLKCRRDQFSNMVVDGNMQLTTVPQFTHSQAYSSQGCFSKSISTMDLLSWATQIANGLQYLESLGVIHGDLATRNILLDSDRVAKIGDFGLSRRLIDYSSYYYTKTSQAPLPWKWMAPESLKDMRFSKKSDIWSFGILLWEIFTLGQTPYPGLTWDETFVDRLEKGMRPIKPTFSTNLLYELMRDCWQLEPHDRPSILDLKRALEDMTSSALRQKGDLSYLRLFGEKAYMTMIKEADDGYLLPNHLKRQISIDA